MKRGILGLFSVIMITVLIGCPSPATDTPASDKTITILHIPGVVAPVRGAVPVTTAIDTMQYTGTITWSPAVSVFSASTEYTSTIVLTAKTGWTLTGVAANSFTVMGATSIIYPKNTGVVIAFFPKTGAAPDINVTFSGAIQAGGTSNMDSSTSLTLNFSVDPTTLAASDITLIGAGKGLLSGSGTTRSLAISGISVADGATVSIAIANPTGFAITGSPQMAVVYKVPNTINLLTIPGVVTPVRGSVPITTAIDTTQYTGTVSWIPLDSPFGPGTVYTANI